MTSIHSHRGIDGDIMISASIANSKGEYLTTSFCITDTQAGELIKTLKKFLKEGV
jgi:hypothetical protein